MTAGPMRRTPSTLLARARVLKPQPSAALTAFRRYLANVRDTDGISSQTWFNSSIPCSLPAEPGGARGTDYKPPDERTLKLGKTIRILHDRLPTLLASPLPQEIISPQITLHLFPSTHPHLPTVSGRLAYTAALWTAPVAWGRVPVVGNVKLHILSERMVRNGNGGGSSPSGSPNFRNEKLIVKWKTCGKSRGKGDKITEFLGREAKEDEKEFCGLFIFEFDEEGRIVTHTIEHAEEGGSWDKMTRVISVTDWLLGKAWGKKEQVPPGLALGYCESGGGERRAQARGRSREA